MANIEKIILKHRDDSTGAPTELESGEIAINTLDKKIYAKDKNNDIVEIGGNTDVAEWDDVANNSQDLTKFVPPSRLGAMFKFTNETFNSGSVEPDIAMNQTFISPPSGYSITDLKHYSVSCTNSGFTIGTFIVSENTLVVVRNHTSYARSTGVHIKAIWSKQTSA